MSLKNVRVPDSLTQKAEDACKRMIYRKVGQKVGGELLISGAEKKWKTEDYIYISHLRIVGKESDLREFLQKQEVTKSDTDLLLKNGYTAERVKSGNVQKLFKNEILNLEEFRKVKSKGKSKYDLNSLLEIASQLKEPEDKLPTEKAVVRKTKNQVTKRKVSVKTVDVAKSKETSKKHKDVVKPSETHKVSSLAASTTVPVNTKKIVTKEVKVESVKKAGSGPAAKGKPLAKPIK